ncbi:hypothetical protein HBI56_000100 [Parastagonospora nodorum]|uniref:Uncharacterized protein n=1 Tax=Phaeosphaeria nodorum (strain SN15 / ATCC MYA-4574 / FGSC 10173) TaxID=321614 RepID=A0A7U2EUY5_PHANO|nr:hypothetical protein HBH56_140980 [Parastagonospora nodorum]QRC91594.1 hypothetical protein JI435_300670 [Parastagonospora nodorum SN15]KAH3927973.1 hypothetical protein HBH54_146120 [Parastagonospora nodorum]KAH3949132.1 hypothetical protein HBH53_096120 [Parastagonospora nodorum]KAH3972528.1 hypothetical protein HBH52_149130 [Parastagonospora nodorum]
MLVSSLDIPIRITAVCFSRACPVTVMVQHELSLHMPTEMLRTCVFLVRHEIQRPGLQARPNGCATR